jgi:hypothetical protein
MLHCGGKMSLPWKTSLCEAESSSDVNIQYQDKCGQMVLGGGLSAVIKEELTDSDSDCFYDCLSVCADDCLHYFV